MYHTVLKMGIMVSVLSHPGAVTKMIPAHLIQQNYGFEFEHLRSNNNNNNNSLPSLERDNNLQINKYKSQISQMQKEMENMRMQMQNSQKTSEQATQNVECDTIHLYFILYTLCELGLMCV